MKRIAIWLPFIFDQTALQELLGSFDGFNLKGMQAWSTPRVGQDCGRPAHLEAASVAGAINVQHLTGEKAVEGYRTRAYDEYRTLIEP
jgi:hypothetical protein